MAKQKKQTRRSVSMKGITYQRIYNWCQKQDPKKSISGYVEEIVAEHLKYREPMPAEVTFETRKKKKDAEDEKIISSHFTF